jgi:glycosyltransferase involved in cell wall biosynthesis
MKKILMLNYEFPPLWWWQANANFHLLKEFLNYKDDFSIDLITSSTDVYREEQFWTNIKIYFLDIWKKNQNLHSQSIKDLLLNFYKTFFSAKKLLKNQSYDCIVCWSYPAIGIWYLFKKIYKIPYISLLRGSETPFYEKKWKILDTYIFQYLAPIFWKNSKYVIANSEWLKDLALKISPNQKIEIIENGIDLEKFNIEKKIDKNFFKILFVWRLTKRKWVEYLIKWFKKFSKDKNNVILNIVWTWEEENNLKELVKSFQLENKIHFLWNISHWNLPEIYNSNDIYILPSENEWMSNTLLEALASSMPIIITNVWWTNELFNWNGWIIKERDESDICEKLDLAYEIWLNRNLEKLWKLSFEVVKDKSWNSVLQYFIHYIK